MTHNEDPIRERTLEEKIDHLITLVAVLSGRVVTLEKAVLPQDPDEEIGLP